MPHDLIVTLARICPLANRGDCGTKSNLTAGRWLLVFGFGNTYYRRIRAKLGSIQSPISQVCRNSRSHQNYSVPNSATLYRIVW